MLKNSRGQVMNTLRFGSAVVIVVATMASAKAADLLTKAPPLPPPAAAGWTGWYVGANAGWAGSASNTVTNTGTDTGIGGLGSAIGKVIPASIPLGYSGFIGGAQFGYNWQVDYLVAGLEIDFDGISAKAGTVIPDAPPPPGFLPAPVSTSATRALDWLGTFRGRVGVTPVAPLLLYATGGLAVGERSLGIGVVAPVAIPPVNVSNQASNTSAGWTIGAGVEWMFAPHWSLKAEYLYVDLGNISSTIAYAYPGNSSTLTATARDTMNIVRGGVSYHF